jgi:hypothetical protein
MAVGEMLQQVFKRKNIKLFFQQVGALGSYTFQILNWIG